MPTWCVYSLSGGLVRLQSGLLVETLKLPTESLADTSLWIVPGLALNTVDEVAASAGRADLQAAAGAIAAHVTRGGRVAACCSAVFLLQSAGVLKHRRVTTTWWLASLLQRMDPSCTVDARRMVCADGPIVTGGAAFAQTDLMLHLMRQFGGTKLADALSRALLIDARQAQGTYVVPEILANGDAFVSRIVARVEGSLPDAPSVATLAREFGVSERTLGRHIHRVTGQSTVVLLQSIKLRAARALLEQSRYSVEDVAAAVGYSDSTALRRLMKRATGSSPSSYRPAVAASRPVRPGQAPRAQTGLST
jgi:transcriptional regulator GlxA family with amidase domain